MFDTENGSSLEDLMDNRVRLNPDFPDGALRGGSGQNELINSEKTFLPRRASERP